MLNFEFKHRYDIDDFIKVIKLLRSPEGCPWDREQTHESIKRNLLEESYEAADAITNQDTENLCEELGDVLMQVIFHADIEEQEGRFSFDDVADRAVKKLINRHPHVFAQTQVSDSQEVLQRWDEIKRAEKNQTTVSSSLKSVPNNLPSLWRAEKILKKASKAHPDHYNNLQAALVQFNQSVERVPGQIEQQQDITHSIGQTLFSLVNLARIMGIDAEYALGGCCDTFIENFERQENASGGQSISENAKKLKEPERSLGNEDI